MSSESRINQALRELPRTLDETYERVVCSIPDRDRDVARKAILMLAFQGCEPRDVKDVEFFFETPCCGACYLDL